MTLNYNILRQNINWIKVNKYISGAQIKMVEAYREGNLTKLHKLQYLAVMSFAFRAYTVRKVTSNKGRKTPSVDNILWNNPKIKFKAVSKLRTIILHSKKYKPKLIKRVLIW